MAQEGKDSKRKGNPGLKTVEEGRDLQNEKRQLVSNSDALLVPCDPFITFGKK